MNEKSPHHRRLLEKWLHHGLSKEEERHLPEALKERARAHFATLIEQGMDDFRAGRTVDGPTAMKNMREELETRRK